MARKDRLNISAVPNIVGTWPCAFSCLTHYGNLSTPLLYVCPP